ncbi:MAG TPA: hypothetical protein VHZ03_12375 [Trebonia sp.]|nr:hypothetical protein [Trebonia sp.]
MASASAARKVAGPSKSGITRQAALTLSALWASGPAPVGGT